MDKEYKYILDNKNIISKYRPISGQSFFELNEVSKQYNILDNITEDSSIL